MRKALSLALALCLALSVTACGGKSGDNVSFSDSAEQSTTAEMQAQRVEPLLSTKIDMENLADGNYAVSFSTDDIINDGELQELRFTVYNCDLYDTVEVAQLTAGDTLVVNGEDIAVESVEQTDYGISVNGGLENGGVDLSPGEGGTYYLSLMDNNKDYQPVGEITLPFAEDFIFTDDSDQSNPGQTFNVDELSSMEGDTQGFIAANTTLTMVGGYIAAIERMFMP